MVRILRSKVSGFTLVELLIVVSIIGVLATIGVPTFRTMVQKAKKSEAKVALGGLYTSETAFFAEYSTYGNVFDKIGFDLEGNAVNRIYSVGFLNTTCAVVSSGTAIPTTASSQGAALNLAFPGYFAGTVISVYAASNPPTGTCGVAAQIGSISPTDFRANAYGFIAPAATLSDGWTIDRARNLVNIQDGIQK